MQNNIFTSRILISNLATLRSCYKTNTNMILSNFNSNNANNSLHKIQSRSMVSSISNHTPTTNSVQYNINQHNTVGMQQNVPVLKLFPTQHRSAITSNTFNRHLNQSNTTVNAQQHSLFSTQNEMLHNMNPKLNTMQNTETHLTHKIAPNGAAALSEGAESSPLHAMTSNKMLKYSYIWLLSTFVFFGFHLNESILDYRSETAQLRHDLEQTNSLLMDMQKNVNINQLPQSDDAHLTLQQQLKNITSTVQYHQQQQQQNSQSLQYPPQVLNHNHHNIAFDPHQMVSIHHLTHLPHFNTQLYPHQHFHNNVDMIQPSMQQQQQLQYHFGHLPQQQQQPQHQQQLIPSQIVSHSQHVSRNPINTVNQAVHNTTNQLMNNVNNNIPQQFSLSYTNQSPSQQHQILVPAPANNAIVSINKKSQPPASE